MHAYVYDGTFDGLLTAIYEAYYRGEQPERIAASGEFQEDFLMQSVDIHTDTEKAGRVYRSIIEKISLHALEYVFYAFLSETQDVGTAIYKYLKLGWKVGGTVDDYLAKDEVLRVHELHRKVASERHALLGLIRFRSIGEDRYYAPIEPRYNTIGLLAPHFVQRLSDQHWMIHDVKRGIGAVYNQKEWIITEINLHKEIRLSEEEQYWQSLWKEYFKKIAIKERINPKLQKSNMPMKYWKYLIEKN
ncbi:MAG: TIGR03915 family putative DNA repair protein [Bacillota bacterium]